VAGEEERLREFEASSADEWQESKLPLPIPALYYGTRSFIIGVVDSRPVVCNRGTNGRKFAHPELVDGVLRGRR